jgi:hypothetical protein
MDVAAVLDEVEAVVAACGERVCVVGALALAAWGRPRFTADLDVLVGAACREALIAALEQGGYETLHASAGFSNHVHPDAARGRVDALYVDAATAGQVFAAASPRLELGGRRHLVPSPEHLVALKLHAIRNDPGRAFRDLADVDALMSLPELDVAAVRPYFEQAGRLAEFEALRSRHGR